MLCSEVLTTKQTKPSTLGQSVSSVYRYFEIASKFGRLCLVFQTSRSWRGNTLSFLWYNPSNILPFITQVAISNKQCLSQGDSSCLLNYEKQKNHIIRVKTTDNGSPQLSYEKNFRIDVRDINDIPRDLQLSNNQVKEDAKISTLIGR